MFRLVLTITFLLISLRIEAATFTILNSCAYTVWPGILSNAGVSPLTTTGFALRNGESKTITTPSGWGGRFWGRTLCSTNSSTGLFSCQTADCGSGSIACNSGATPPATLAEFTLDGSGGLDFFDVSLVDGYNLPMVVTPHSGPSGGPNCTVTGCFTDLNGACPSDLRIASLDSGSSSTVACKSACDAFNSPQYCCSGAYGSPDTCKPSSYSMVFKKACPTAYSYAYDDKSSTFTCGGSPDYTITFCASPATSQKAASTSEGQGQQSTVPDEIMNGSMIYEGALDDSSSPSTCPNRLRSQLIAGAIATLMAIWRVSQQM
ncbi:thaumatin-like protein 1b [Silene latifolia]|uniref:thaumatin-like protein 1b n=1 Tax=Silene latifolia TaxID=37657 RepID=UPI003D76CD86